MADITDLEQWLAGAKGAHLAKSPDPFDLERLKFGEHLLASRIHDRWRRGNHVSLLRLPAIYSWNFVRDAVFFPTDPTG
jgi:hypothetical protein